MALSSLALQPPSATQKSTFLTLNNCVKHILDAINKQTITHTHLFNGLFSGTTQVSRYQKGETNLDFTEARDSEWQWHQLGHMQVCTSLQTDNHASTPPLSFYRPDALPAAQPTVSKHWRHKINDKRSNKWKSINKAAYDTRALKHYSYRNFKTAA